MASQTFSSQKYFPIRELTTWTSRWVIKARVIHKAPVNVFHRADGGSGKIGSVDLMDRDGDSIRAKFWGAAADKWIPTLKQGEVYTFSNGRLQVANKRFNNLSHSYELTFDIDAKITPCSDGEDASVEGAIPLIRKYNFISLRDVQHSPRSLPFLVDLIVALKWISPNVEQFTQRATQDVGVRRLCHVVDDTGFQLTLTLFGDHVHVADDLLDTIRDPKRAVILALQNIQIREFRGRNASTLHSTHIAVNPDIPEADNLRQWVASLPGALQDESFKLMSEGNNLGSDISKNSDNVESSSMTLAEVWAHVQNLSTATENSSELYVVDCVEPSRLLYTNRALEVALCYPACHKCNRKVMQSDNENLYRCEACQIDLMEPSYRYIFAMHLVDCSGGRFTVRTFHDAGRAILRKDATALANMAPPGSPATDIPSEMRELLEYDALWRKYRMGLRGRREFFGGEERTSVSVVFAEPLDYNAHGKRLLADILTLLPNATAFGASRKRQHDNSDFGGGCTSAEHFESTREAKREKIETKIPLDDNSTAN